MSHWRDLFLLSDRGEKDYHVSDRVFIRKDIFHSNTFAARVEIRGRTVADDSINVSNKTKPGKTHDPEMQRFSAVVEKFGKFLKVKL